MADAGDDNLADLIRREQRGLRGILHGGLATLLVMVLMSAALGAYLFVTSQGLAETTRTLEKQAFDTRRAIDAQNNRLASQQRNIRRTYQEIRDAMAQSDDGPITTGDVDVARAATEAFLFRNRNASLSEQVAIMQIGAASAQDARGVSRAERDLFAGVAAIQGYQSRGESIEEKTVELPKSLREAIDAFIDAGKDKNLAPMAAAGLAWVAFEDASSERNDYSVRSCKHVLEEVAAALKEDAPAPQPLYWRAQCERKTGQTTAALADYARALRQFMGAAPESEKSAPKSETAEPTRRELNLGVRAFEGVGTMLIAGVAVPDDAPGMKDALEIAQEACLEPEKHEGRSPRMALALACLDAALDLRRRLDQSPNQQSNTAQIVSFAHLRDHDVTAAYKNSVDIEATGLFAWNELVRALTAPQVSLSDPAEQHAAQVAAADARRNVGLFKVSQFTLCELQTMLDADTYAAGQKLIAETHPGEKAECIAD
jgi:hypothetical protein